MTDLLLEKHKHLYTDKILREKGYSKAAICAILANMEHESSFRTDIIGDNGTSYGLCQWHAGRWTNLKNFCSDNGYDVASIEGQMAYMDHELQTNQYKHIYDKLMNVPDTLEGAQEASKYWTINNKQWKNRKYWQILLRES